MEFCKNCHYHLKPDTSKGVLTFVCESCKEKYNSSDDHSLRSEVNYETEESNQKYEVFEENAAHDLANKKINAECPKCYAPFMTHIYIGNSYLSKYVCPCGFKINNVDYNKLYKKQ